MKVQFILAACLVAAAFAAPVADQFIDPDCIEEDMIVEEPVADIEAQFALDEPSIRRDFSVGDNDVNDECEDEPVEQTTVAEEECEDEPITDEPTTEAAPETEACVSEIAETEPPAPEPTAAECEEEITEAEPADECEEGEGEDAAPELDFQIEPAHVIADTEFIGEESNFPEVEECEE